MRLHTHQLAELLRIHPLLTNHLTPQHTKHPPLRIRLRVHNLLTTLLHLLSMEVFALISLLSWSTSSASHPDLYELYWIQCNCTIISVRLSLFNRYDVIFIRPVH